LPPQTLKIVVLILFIITYIFLFALTKYRALVAAGAAAVFIIIGAMPVAEIGQAINFNVLMMIAGTMGTVFLFNESKMPALLADLIIEKTPNVKWAIISLSIFAGIVSAFIDNVATVLMVAPIALNIAKKLNMSPVASIIAISIASNLEGAATLVGDTTSIMLGGYAGMNFIDFFFFQGRVGMFWIVQVGLLLATLVLLMVFRREKQPIVALERTKVTHAFPTVMLLGTVILLIAASFFENAPTLINGYICIGLFIIGLIYEFIRTKSVKPIISALKEIDYMTLLQLAALFVVVASISNVGIIDDIGSFFINLSDNIFVIYTLIVWISVILSAFIDNIPYTATMLPVVSSIAAGMNIEPYILYFGLLVGATLGGNLTPVGASANVAAIGILRKEGYEVSTGTFMKISVPYTLAAVIGGYVMLWIFWS